MNTAARRSRSGSTTGGYSFLHPDLLLTTLEKLSDRIGDRFPQAGLFRVSRHLSDIARDITSRVNRAAEPIIWIRVIIGLLILFILIGIASTVTAFRVEPGELTWIEFIQVLEAGINDVVLIGAGIFFLFTLETRVKRRRAMEALDELRSVAHVIDMHQLTKDPHHAAGNAAATDTPPKDQLSPDELFRYLDYCSEMLSLVGKLAALYLQRFDDSVVLTAVNEIEELTTGLSRKIWQKLMILHAAQPAR